MSKIVNLTEYFDVPRADRNQMWTLGELGILWSAVNTLASRGLAVEGQPYAGEAGMGPGFGLITSDLGAFGVITRIDGDYVMLDRSGRLVKRMSDLQDLVDATINHNPHKETA